MKITKLGHCCMLIEEKGVKLLTDPGSFTVEKNITITGLDGILYTHEHGDHYHLQSLQALLKNNPKVKVLANPSVAAILAKEGIAHEVLANGGNSEIKGVPVSGHGMTHAIIHSSLPPVQNTGFFIAERLWYPGDELGVDPGLQPDIMALPLAGPWLKFGEAIDYALKLKPKMAFAVHDMVLNPMFAGFIPQMAGPILEPRGTRFFGIELEKEYEF
jgi:L-ascorbate metabolism protein UlaG (beta-lactamase superfamily)